MCFYINELNIVLYRVQSSITSRFSNIKQCSNWILRRDISIWIYQAIERFFQAALDYCSSILFNIKQWDGWIDFDLPGIHYYQYSLASFASSNHEQISALLGFSLSCRITQDTSIDNKFANLPYPPTPCDIHFASAMIRRSTNVG